MLSNFDVRVLTGSDYVEVRPKQVHKGQMIAKAFDLCRGTPDFVLCIGACGRPVCVCVGGWVGGCVGTLSA